MGHTAELNKVDTLIEDIHQHVHVNSWMNVKNWDNWVMGGASNEGDAHDWHMMNSVPQPKYWKAWECDAETFKGVKSYFEKLGVQFASETLPEGTTPTCVYIYRTMF